MPEAQPPQKIPLIFYRLSSGTSLCGIGCRSCPTWSDRR
jgi:hypothetical protein